MVRCNLSVLLAERNLRITKVCKDTGISRTTLTYLANNYSKGIQYDTLNTLCAYLRVSPGELISFVPVDVFLHSVGLTGKDMENLTIELDITYNGISQRCYLCGYVFQYVPSPDDPNTPIRNRYKPCAVEIYITLWDFLDDPDVNIKKENELIVNALNALPISFLKDLESKIEDKVVDILDRKYNLETLPASIDVSLKWDISIIKPPTTE